MWAFKKQKNKRLRPLPTLCCTTHLSPTLRCLLPIDPTSKPLRAASAGSTDTNARSVAIFGKSTGRGRGGPPAGEHQAQGWRGLRGGAGLRPPCGQSLCGEVGMERVGNDFGARDVGVRRWCSWRWDNFTLLGLARHCIEFLALQILIFFLRYETTKLWRKKEIGRFLFLGI